MSADVTYRPGTVVRYHPDPARHDPHWCREGMAVADARGLLVDTYWGSMSDAHLVTETERASVELVGHLDDYDRLSRHQSASDYHPGDRLTITHQHRLQRDEYVRKGAMPHLGTQIRNQVARVREAERELDSARRRVERDRHALDDLLAQRAPRPTPAEEAGR